MKAAIQTSQYRTCYLCGESVMTALVLTGSGGYVTVCLPCWTEMVRVGVKAVRKENVVLVK